MKSANANIIFIFDGSIIQIQCNINDKMFNICERYSNKIGQDINSLQFLYGEKQINMDSKLDDYQDIIDNRTNILVYKKEPFICPKYEEKNQLNEIILSNKEIMESINEIKLQMNNINMKLNIINQNIKNNEQRINKLFNDKNSNIENKNNINNDKNNKNNIKNKKNNLIVKIKLKGLKNKIFSYVSEKKKLKLIKYNKSKY